MANNFYCRDSVPEETKQDMQDKINQLLMVNQKQQVDLTELWNRHKLLQQVYDNIVEERKEWKQKNTTK